MSARVERRFSRAVEDRNAALEVAHLAIEVAERARAPSATVARLREMIREIMPGPAAAAGRPRARSRS